MKRNQKVSNNYVLKPIVQQYILRKNNPPDPARDQLNPPKPAEQMNF